MADLSLRARMLLGTVLWTAGLFGLAGVALTWSMVRHPDSPRIMHGLFSHGAVIAVVALVCMAAGVWELKRGLDPFQRLRARLGGVREGRAGRVDGIYPSEVQPLVDDLNALLQQRERAIARASAKAGDLAHGLKTPLAVLMQEAERLQAAGFGDEAGTIAQQVHRMRRQIDYHLAHARAAASGGTPGAHCRVAESAEGLARTLRRLHAERGVSIRIDVPGDLVARVQRQDLDELLGNLLDNACKWARSSISLESYRRNGRVVIQIDDDGRGIDPSLRKAVLQRGVRADEAAPGSGLGLAIVADLVELYGGSFTLGGSPAGGLRACVELPA